MRRRKRKRKGRSSRRPSSMVTHSTMDMKVVRMRLNTRTWVQMVWTHSTSSTVVDRLFPDRNITTTTLCLSTKDKGLEDLLSSRFQWTCSSRTCSEDRLRVGTRHSCSTTVKAALSLADKTRTAWCEWPRRPLSRCADPTAKWWWRERSKSSNNTLTNRAKKPRSSNTKTTWASTKTQSTKSSNTRSRSDSLLTRLTTLMTRVKTETRELVGFTLI